MDRNFDSMFLGQLVLKRGAGLCLCIPARNKDNALIASLCLRDPVDVAADFGQPRLFGAESEGPLFAAGF